MRLGAGERNHAAAVHTQHTTSAPSPRKLKHATAEKQKKKNLSVRTCYTCSSARARRRVLAVRGSDNRSSERSPLTQRFLPLHHVSAAAPPPGPRPHKGRKRTAAAKEHVCGEDTKSPLVFCVQIRRYLRTEETIKTTSSCKCICWISQEANSSQTDQNTETLKVI